MSAVATKEESWLNIAQVTESLWPVDKIKGEKNDCMVSRRCGKQFYLQLRAAEDSGEMRLPGFQLNYQSNLENTRHKAAPLQFWQ